jgi:hypothetical protein
MGGRGAKLTTKELSLIKQCIDNGMAINAIARKLGRTWKTIKDNLHRLNELEVEKTAETLDKLDFLGEDFADISLKFAHTLKDMSMDDVKKLPLQIRSKIAIDFGLASVKLKGKDKKMSHVQNFIAILQQVHSKGFYKSLKRIRFDGKEDN